MRFLPAMRPPSTPTPGIHQSAKSGYGRGARNYAKGRPGYPAEIDGWLAKTLSLSPAHTVLDLGAGTGKFTKYLTKTGACVIAIEPVTAMLAELRGAVPSVETRQGSAADIPVADESIDALFCAQAFHWFASVETLAEIHRVLKPGGTFGLIWNIRDERCDWVAALSRIVAPYGTGTPSFHDGQWRRIFPAEGFGDLQERTVSHTHTGDPQTVIVNRVLSVSFIAALPESEQDIVVQRLHKLIGTHPGLKGKAEIAFPYTTLLAWAYKSPDGRAIPDGGRRANRRQVVQAMMNHIERQRTVPVLRGGRERACPVGAGLARPGPLDRARKLAGDAAVI